MSQERDLSESAFGEQSSIDTRESCVKGELRMKSLIEYIARALVDNPEAVQVREVEGEKTTVYELRVGQGDLGKVIGKRGRTARSIRTLLNAAATKAGKRAVLEILE
jgi:predicted RNA-binding protein YlqC (UPF0109 family)